MYIHLHYCVHVNNNTVIETGRHMTFDTLGDSMVVFIGNHMD